MADPSPNPTKPRPEQSRQTPHTPSATSVADDSDTEFVPTPIHSPGGPRYDDLPPSYDEAQEQAAADARNGVPLLDPNELEAHRLTLNEGPNEPEVWEYRFRGERIDDAHAHESAPDYGRTVPIEHVQTSTSIPVGQTGNLSTTTADPINNLLNTALRFTHHEPDADSQYAPRLARPIAIPQQGLVRSSTVGERHNRRRRRSSRDERSVRDHAEPAGDIPHASSDYSIESVQFLRAYAKALHPHSIRPAEFTEFLDGLNVLCEATYTTAQDLLQGETMDGPTSLVHNYISGANEAFFAPRGLRASLVPFSTLLENLNIPAERGQQSRALAGVLDPTSTTERRAQALYPWIEALETNVPSQSSQVLTLQEMSVRLMGLYQNNEATSAASNRNSSEKVLNAAPELEHDGPPHSIPDGHDRDFGSRGRGHHGRRGRDSRHGGPWGPFGPRGHGPFGPHGHGPFGRHGHGPFGPRGHGPFGPHGHSPFGPHGHGPFGRGGHGPFGGPNRGPFGAHGHGPFGPHRPGPGDSAHHGRNRDFQSHGQYSRGNPNDWAAWGEQIGKWGEEFGKRMEDWGTQFGRRAETWGQDVGKAAEAWGQDISTRASGSGSQPQTRQVPADAHSPEHPQPSYPEGSDGQESGVIRERTHESKKAVDKDDDVSSISSDSSDSDSDSDSDDDDHHHNTEAEFLKRVQSINEQADAQLKKGKKSPEEVEKEREVAIKKAEFDREFAGKKMEEKRGKRQKKREFKKQHRELKSQYRQKKREMKESYKGKGKDKVKKSKEWRDVKKEYFEKKDKWRREKQKAHREWHEARWERKRAERERLFGDRGQVAPTSELMFVVIENLRP